MCFIPFTTRDKKVFGIVSFFSVLVDLQRTKKTSGCTTLILFIT